ncbi:MAG: hypothetical protein KCHDKBKB_00379 [Elusimicrobia bacterium]|nr:hypothetical protein [Elusimicrobiota bacterium]
MSYLVEQETVCPHCSYPNQAEIWSVINVQLDPELRDLLLGGEINMIECVSCKEIFYAENFVLYHDPSTQLMAFVYPQSYANDKSRWESKTLADFSHTQSTVPEAERLTYQPVTLFGMDALVFLVEDEEEQSIQAEIVKFYSQEHGFKFKTLSPSQARLKKIPPVIPYLGENEFPARERVLEALEKIKIINDRLSVYVNMEEKLKQDPQWVLDR